MPLYLELTELLQVEYRLCKNFSKFHRHTLGLEVLNLTWQLLDLFIQLQCGKLGASVKQQQIQLMSVKHEQLKLRLRFLAELGELPLKQQAILHKKQVVIGKMLGSWLKNV